MLWGRAASGGQLLQAGGQKAAAARRPSAEADEARAAALRVLIAEDNAINMKARAAPPPASLLQRVSEGLCSGAPWAEVIVYMAW